MTWSFSLFPIEHQVGHYICTAREQCNLFDAMVILGVKGGLKKTVTQDYCQHKVGDDVIMCCTALTEYNENPTLERRRYWIMNDLEYEDIVLVHYRYTKDKDRSTPLLSSSESTRNLGNETNEDSDYASALDLSFLSNLEDSDAGVSAYYDLCERTSELNIEGQHFVNDISHLIKEAETRWLTLLEVGHYICTTREQCNLSDAMVILGVKGGLKKPWLKIIVNIRLGMMSSCVVPLLQNIMKILPWRDVDTG